MSAFDPAAFENMVVEEANETESTPVPEGDYLGLIDKVSVRGQEIKNGSRAGETVPILDVVYALNDDDGKLAKQLNRDKITVRQQIWLDLNENSALAFGPNQNVQLGRLRDAVGLNKTGKPFTFKQLEGQGPLAIYVTNRTLDDGRVFDEVKRVQRPTN